MKRNATSWLAAIILLFWVMPLPAQYQTTGGGCGAVGLVEFCEYQFGDDGDPVRQFAEDQGFVFWEVIQDEVATTPNPQVSVADALEAREYVTDYLYTATHGNFDHGYSMPEGIAVEGYVSHSLRMQVFNSYINSGTYSYPADIYMANAETYHGSGVYYYLICVTKQRMLSHVTVNTPWVEVRGHCEGTDWIPDFEAMGAFCVAYSWILDNDDAFANVDTFFTYANAERGQSVRTTSEAASRMVDGLGGHWLYGGPSNIVASPAVTTVYPPAGHVFNTGSFQNAYIDFDTPIEPYWDLDDVLGISSVNQGGEIYPYADLTNLRLLNEGTRLEFDLENIRYQSDFAVWINALETKGAGSADRFLDGNTDPWGNDPPFYTGVNCRPPNGDDYVIHWISNVGEYPASTVAGFLAKLEADGVHLTWDTESEFSTDYYRVTKWVISDSLWQLVGEISGTGNPDQGASYLLVDPAGLAGDHYRLFEVEESGRILPYGEAEALAELPQNIPNSCTVPQIQKWYKEEEYAGAGRVAEGKSGVEVLHICPAAWVTALQPLAYHQMVHQYQGYSVQIVTLEEIGSDSSAEDIRDYILQYDETLHDVTLWGVANRSDPGEEVIPAFYHPYQFYYWNPEYCTNEGFGDRDGDGWDDLVVARMPAKTVHDVYVLVDKTISYDYTERDWWRRQALALCGDVDYGTCSGQLARELTEDLVSLMQYPINGATTTLYWSEIPGGYWGRENQCAYYWNAGAHLVFGLSGVSNRTCHHDFQSKYFNPDVVDRLEPNGCYPVVLAQSCGTAGYGDGQPPYGSDLAYDLMTADWKGPLIWIGYTENTNQLINWFMAREFLSRIDMDGPLTAGEIYLQVKELTRQLHPEAADQIKMWIFLGNPTTRIRWTDVTTSVLGENSGVISLAQNHPNPFNPTTTITFSLPVGSPVSLAVYDVAGRKVCQLVDDRLQAGEHRFSWDGTNYHGNGVSSGTYFLRLETPSVCLNRKMLLLK